MQEYLPLWEKIQQFPLDDGKASFPFSKKLAATQQWSAPFTSKAIEEYRKFLLLCCISDKGAAPSKAVDEVWHLHLTYTRSYWIDLCRNTLGKELHHYPSAGGTQEDQRHQQWYQETLEMYQTVFGQEPPADIWPASSENTQASPLTLQQEEASTRSNNQSLVIKIVILLSLPFLFIWLSYNTLFPFALNGKQFLLYFPLFSLTLFISYCLYRTRNKQALENAIASQLPGDITPFQIAGFLYGKHRAIQAGLIDLLERDLLELQPDKHFLIKNRNYTPLSDEINPLIPAFLLEEDGNTITYESISVNWYDRSKFSHPFLDKLDQFVHEKEPFWQAYPFHVIFLTVALGRMIQGSVHDRPILLLVLETIFLSLLYFFIIRRFVSRHSMVYNKIQSLYKERLNDLNKGNSQIASQFAIDGIPAIHGISQGILLAGIFGAFTPGYFRTGLSDMNNGSWSSNSGCSSGSSCSGGSSCGSSCGGGGCGGCGGGGD